MVQQEPLFDGREHDRIVVATDRRTPAVWIAELRVLRELAEGDQPIVRRIILRRGMNIFWAKEPDSQKQKQLFEDSISGHSAGKTTFCRFLRYLLCEPHFGDEQLRQEIRRAFPNGWIAGQVFVAESRWAVFRPIAVGAHPFVVREATIDEALAADAPRESLENYREALNTAVLPPGKSDWLATRSTLLRWEHVMQWLSRDQDCHFSDLITWRNSSSDSDSPQLDSSDRQLMLRGLLGLISDEEDRERRANDKRNLDRKKLAADRPSFLHQAAVDRSRLEQSLGKSLPPFDDGLFRDAVTNDLDTFERDGLAELVPGDSRDSEDALAALDRSLQAAVQEEAEMAARVKELCNSLARQQANVDALTGKITEESRRALLEDLGPSTGFCNIPIEEAEKSGCPLAVSRPVRLADRVAEIGLDEQVAKQDAAVAALKRQLQALEPQLLSLAAASENARTSVQTARRKFAAQVRQVSDFKSQVTYLKRLAKDAEQAWAEAAALAQEDVNLKQEIEQSYKRQDAIREQLNHNLAAFSARFDHFIAALIGSSVEGKVVFSGRDIGLKVLHRGERRSSAIKILSNIAFDLAALTFGMEGRGFHPRLLIHDGPREADMSPGLYRKVFLLVRLLEDCAEQGNEPAFQYIITTTEAPPEDLQCKPWLLEPILDAADPKKRFLGIDL